MTNIFFEEIRNIKKNVLHYSKKKFVFTIFFFVLKSYETYAKKAYGWLFYLEQIVT